MDEEMESCGAGPIPEIHEPEIDPPAWIRTEWLDTALFNAIMDDSSGSEHKVDFEEALHGAGDGLVYSDEMDQRRTQLRILSTMQPQLAELIGGPPAPDPE